MRRHHRILSAFAIAVILSACSSVEEASDAAASQATETAEAPETETVTEDSGSDTAPAPAASFVDGDFSWDAIDFGCDFVDDVEARGRVTNGGPDVSSASFTITVLQGGSIVATLTGFVDDLASGQTKTVEFISLDDCLRGDFTFDVQTDFSLAGSSDAGSSDPSGDTGDFSWDLVDFGCDFVDDVEARGRVTNEGGDVSSASFTITVFQNGAIVATLTGFVDSLANGQTKTVEFISLDDCLQGEFTYEIQTDFAM